MDIQDHKELDHAINTDEGISWILYPTSKFDTALVLFRDTLGIQVSEQGNAVTGYHFNRYAQMTMPNVIVLEIVETKPEYQHLFKHPVLSITVSDLQERVSRLSSEGIIFISEIIHTHNKPVTQPHDGGKSLLHIRHACTAPGEAEG